MTAHGHIHWNELNTRDVEKAKGFFSDTIGWTFEGMPMPGFTYWVANMDGKPVGGVFSIAGSEFEGVPNHWLAYLSVDDVDARVKRAKTAGATVIREPFDIPHVGRMAILKDPTGAVMGWITPSS